MSDGQLMEVSILDREYKIKCPPEQTQELQEAARLVDNRMRELRKAGHNSSSEHVAVVTALNMAHDLMLTKQQKHSYIDMMSNRIQELHQKIDQAIEDAEANAAL
ncbi:MAG: hypothetical protein A3F17_02040 [Gammaproteobacteria bacterium RIFCSPHIGHO2_12_FULL_41_15]|nr:MAG: hypothetical protein A3F17_02040 [Gammaproteobacteria bacterium RIFCSPHIGHO2_12_FULL_41_15]